MSDRTYQGQELDLFFLATNWKNYWLEQIRAYIGDAVLEVGAGIGANACRIAHIAGKELTCLEPDPGQAAQLEDQLKSAGLLNKCCVLDKYTEELDQTRKFDTILYIDVLEHIEHDGLELQRTKGLLAPGGHLIILSPAHAFLYSPFDKALGHYRRYNKKSLKAAIPPGLQEVKLVYLDSVGLLASAANRLLLSQANPSKDQVLLWDRRFVPVSRILDPVFGYRIGKSIMGVWRNPTLPLSP